MKKQLIILGSLALVLAGNVGWASDPIGVYGLIDDVVLIQGPAGNVERAKIYGTFSVANLQSFFYFPPKTGILYFQMDFESETATLAEWSDLKRLAGSKKCVAFSARRNGNGGGTKITVLNPDQIEATTPNTYHVTAGTGVVLANADNEFCPKVK